MTIVETDKYRPKIHFAPKKNWMNDPNGMVYFEGEYHLFFQYNPNDSVWGPMHWGHAVSKDMVSWEELDIALYPDEHGTIFSGSAVIDWNNTTGFFDEKPGLVAIFTHHLDRGEGETPKQSQSLAYSYDNGRTWEKYNENPVLSHKSKVDFRDPKVFWHSETNAWVMVLATGQTISIYSSKNLIEWKFESEFGEGKGSHEGVWECPDLFKLSTDEGEERWVLLVSIGDNPEYDNGSRTQYFVGNFNGTSFSEEHSTVKWLDFGKDNYAGVSFSDIPSQDSRRIYLGWMSNWRYANEVPTGDWRSQMTLPRELSLRHSGEDYNIVQKPVQELSGYFAKKAAIHDVIVSKGETKNYSVEESYGELTLTIKRVDATQFGLTLHHTKEQASTLTFDSTENLLILDRKKSGEVDFSNNFTQNQRIKINNSDNIQLHIVIDSSSVELFVNEGEYAITSLVYPDKAWEGLSIFTLDGDIHLIDGYLSGPK